MLNSERTHAFDPSQTPRYKEGSHAIYSMHCNRYPLHRTQNDVRSAVDVLDRHSREVATAGSDRRGAGCTLTQSTGDNWRKRRWLQGEKEAMTVTGDVGQPKAGTSTPPLVLSVHRSGRHPLHLKKRQKQKERTRHATDSTMRFLPNDVGEAAKQFCKDCRDAAKGVCVKRPPLSFYVDAVMKTEMVVTSVAEDNEKMVFVKTSDGLTRVVFSSKMDENLDADAVAITHTLGVSSSEQQTTQQSPSEQTAIPITTPLATMPLSVPEEKETITMSRVINPRHSFQPATQSNGLPFAPLVTQTMPPLVPIPIKGQVIRKNDHIFERSMPVVPKGEGFSLQGAPEALSPAAPSTSSTISNLSRPMPLARFGSCGPSPSPPVQTTEIPFTFAPYTQSSRGPAVMFTPNNATNGIVSSHLDPSKHLASCPTVDVGLLWSQGFRLSAKQQVYPSLRPAYSDGQSILPIGDYYLPSISESLKQAVRPHVPFVKDLETAATFPDHLLAPDSPGILLNVLEWLNSEASMQSAIEKDAQHMGSENGHF